MSLRYAVSLTFLATILVSGEGLHAQEAPSPAAAEQTVATAPVDLDGAVLFRVRGVSSFPAEARADGIRERLVAVASDSSVAVDSIRVVDESDVTRIVAGETTILFVSEADAALEQVRRPGLAAVHLAKIREAVTGYRDARSPEALRRGALNALGATLAFAAIVALLVWLWRLFDRFLLHRLQARVHAVEIQSLELMRAERIWAALRGGLLAVRTLVFLVVALIYFGFVLAQFPRTRGMSRNLGDLALGPLNTIMSGIIASIPSLVFLAVLFFVVRFSLRLIRLFFQAVEHGRVKFENFDAEWAQPTYKIVRIGVVAFALIVAYPYIPGSDSAAFRGVSLFIGVLFSLGSSAAISNIIAGYMMTYRRAFKLGDRIKVGDAVGEVIQMRLQVTHLRSFKNEELIIPNSQILNGEVLNYSSLARSRGLILHTQVGIGYETPWRQVEAMLLMAAERTDGLNKEPPPFILEKALGDFAVTYELNVYCDNVPAMPQLYSQLHRNILDVFNEFGVQIMTPAYEGDPEIPKVVRPDSWYTAPAAVPRSEAGSESRPATSPYVSATTRT
jgi:small-conductance mechanosensitive channel